MKCVICGPPIEEGRKQGQPPLLAKYCLKCRAERRRSSRVRMIKDMSPASLLILQKWINQTTEKSTSPA
jgi:hypothetical protein